MRIAIFNDYWNTMGGGEQSALQIAVALQESHEVWLLTTSPLSIDDMEKHCQSSLHKVNVLQVGKDSYSVEIASAEFDIFINHSHQSTVRNFARHGIYQVMFPQKLDHVKNGRENYVAKRNGLIDRIYGFHLELKDEDCFICDGEGYFSLIPDHGANSMELSLSGVTDTWASIRVFDTHHNIQVTHERLFIPHSKKQSLSLSNIPDSCAIIIKADQTPFSDSTIGIRLHSLSTNHGKTYTATEITRHLSAKIENPANFLKSYDTLVSNSEYTRQWTTEYFCREATVIYPPVVVSEKKSELSPQIISVGRFFGGKNIHSKNQLEMVNAFQNLPESILNSWRLVLVGGTSREHREYAAEVRHQAHNYPVDIFFNASRILLNELLLKSSIYWHFAGFGQDLNIHPEAAEHFGIAIVEAMSAGVVPLVYNAGGPREILKNFPELLFDSIDELIEKTVHLANNQDSLTHLRNNLVLESRKYNTLSYWANWQRLIENYASAPNPNE